MNDLEENLIAGQGRKQAQKKQKKFEQCQLKIKTLRNKNNELQKQYDNQLESDIRQAVKQQTSFIQIEIQDMKKMLEKLAREYTDPASKNKIKDLCNLASRQMQRNKLIMGQYLNRASSSGQYYRRLSNSTAFRKSRTQFQKDIPHKKDRDSNLSPVYERHDKQSMESQVLLSDIKAQQKMMAERNQLIKQLQQKNNKINQIINEMGSIVGGQQHDMVNQLVDNNQIAYQNVLRANEELDDAQKYQKKAKCKYIAIVTIIILVLIIAGGVVYFAIP